MFFCPPHRTRRRRAPEEVPEDAAEAEAEAEAEAAAREAEAEADAREAEAEPKPEGAAQTSDAAPPTKPKRRCWLA